MCRICDGEDPEDLMQEDAARIAFYGYTMQAVGDDEHAPWVYTVGLLDGFDHPELIIAGASLKTSGRILAAMADAVTEGFTYDVGDSITVGGNTISFGAVHEVQYGLSTFATWHNLRDEGVLKAERLEALQIVLGPSYFCSCHQSTQPILSDPEARVGGPPPPVGNRAARRRKPPRRRR
ncbi:MAG TPA: DUF4262 domain-containing protein [Acidimicrobiia bacterium]|nr:DUF4262 domain-containing protein [Acidimicrobiia bacterium]